MLAMIWAQAHGRAIGKDGTLPWHVPEDMAMFKRMTMGHPVIMGRKTWESFNPRWRPLPGRANIVVTRNPSYDAPGADVATSVEEACSIARTYVQERPLTKLDNSQYSTQEQSAGRSAAPSMVTSSAQPISSELVWLIGGAQLYSYALEHNLAEAVLMTELDLDIPAASAFAPAIPADWELISAETARGWRTSEKSDVRYRFTLYRKPESDFWLDLADL